MYELLLSTWTGLKEQLKLFMCGATIRRILGTALAVRQRADERLHGGRHRTSCGPTLVDELLRQALLQFDTVSAVTNNNMSKDSALRRVRDPLIGCDLAHARSTAVGQSTQLAARAERTLSTTPLNDGHSVMRAAGGRASASRSCSCELKWSQSRG